MFSVMKLFGHSYSTHVTEHIEKYAIKFRQRDKFQRNFEKAETQKINNFMFLKLTHFFTIIKSSVSNLLKYLAI